MGYDLRITRSADWTRNTRHEIDSSEWLAVVRDDLELIPKGPNTQRMASYVEPSRSDILERLL